MTETTALYNDKKDAQKGDGGFVRAWVDQWNLAGAGPMDKWCKAAELAFKAYRGDKSSKQTDFNIFHSNVETLVPALYNSTPAPDVRRRYNDVGPGVTHIAAITATSTAAVYATPGKCDR